MEPCNIDTDTHPPGKEAHLIDGTYDVTVKILFTTQNGAVTLTSNGEACTATVDAMGSTQTFEGAVQDNSFSFNGELDGPTGKVAYEVTGTANGKTLTAQAKTPLGNLKIAGSAHE